MNWGEDEQDFELRSTQACCTPTSVLRRYAGKMVIKTELDVFSEYR